MRQSEGVGKGNKRVIIKKKIMKETGGSEGDKTEEWKREVKKMS